ncbi:MAG: pyruvate kinase [Proteobacteria bacterium]|nr:pyruvate kinase [Pseudomonadota bacterium]
MRKAKIVCTIGPVTSSEKQLKALIENGMDVARLNFSHGDHATHGLIVDRIRQLASKLQKNVAILQDLQGIKIRVGGLKGEKVHLNKGDHITIAAGEGTGDEKRLFVSYPWLIEDAKAGDTILLDDGLMKLEVEKKEKDSLMAKVIEGGILKEHKGVNLPHMKIKPGSFMEKDKRDLEFGIQKGVDFVALSFVRIDKANKSGCLVITATQMLESMTQHSRPTRAETTDVANAVIDGTDALMLSGETSAGKYPIEAVKVMDRIIVYTESSMPPSISKRRGIDKIGFTDEASGFPEAVAQAASRAAEDVGAKWIVAFTRSGFTARLISKFRPRTPVIAFSPDEKVVRQMSMYWGVIPHLVRHLENTDVLINEVDTLLIKLGYAKTGDKVIIVASHPPSTSGRTNFMKMHEVRGA